MAERNGVKRWWLSDGVSTVDSSWWAIITYKVIKDIGRQPGKGQGDGRGGGRGGGGETDSLGNATFTQ